MKQGRSLGELAVELERQASAKRDFLADTRTMKFVAEPGIGTMIQIQDQPAFTIAPNAANQIAQRLEIPKKYYDRMAVEAPELLATNVNTWFQRNPEKRMLRTLDGNARAFLSDRYRRLDNFDLAQAVLPVLLEAQAGIVVQSCEVTDDKFYLKFSAPKIQGEIRKGDIVEAGGIISNSEVGKGSLAVTPFVNRLVCLNGMVVNDAGQRRYHVGKGAESNEQSMEIFSDETLRADDRAFWLKVQDTVRATLNAAGFEKILVRLREATEQKITGDPMAAVELMSERLGFSEGEKKGVLTALLMGGDLTAFGMVQAITETSKLVDSYDRATELEAFGGQILTLSKSAWQEIAIAA